MVGSIFQVAAQYSMIFYLDIGLNFEIEILKSLAIRNQCNSEN